MKDNWFTGSCILLLGVCVLMTALPDYRELDRKEKFLDGCMSQWTDSKEETWKQIWECNNLWIGS